MLKPFLFVFKELEGGKRIPRGGLGTNGMLAITETPAWSPSHTVGSEQKDKGFVKVFHAFIKSPSHAVGLEKGCLTISWGGFFCLRHRHPTRWAWNQGTE